MGILGLHVQPFFQWLLRSSVQAGLIVCLILLVHPVADGAEQVAQVEGTGGLNPREHTGHGGDPTGVTGSLRASIRSESHGCDLRCQRLR